MSTRKKEQYPLEKTEEDSYSLPVYDALHRFFSDVRFEEGCFVYYGQPSINAYNGVPVYNYSDVLRLSNLNEQLATAFNILVDNSFIKDKLQKICGNAKAFYVIQQSYLEYQ